MLSRRTILILSIVVSLVLHALLLLLAPQWTVLSARSRSDMAVERFQVQLRDDVPPPPAPEADSSFNLASRPGSVSALRAREEELLDLEDSLLDDPVEMEVPQSEDEPLQRPEFDLEPDDAIQREIDARILEIAQVTAREDIEVARRLVRPSPQRILEPGENPALRVQQSEPEQLPSRLPAIGRSLLSETLDEPLGLPLDSERPEYEDAVLELVGSEPDVPAVQLEEQVARAPLEREVQRAREESRYEFMDDLVDIQLDVYTPPNEQGYFRLQILPRSEGEIRALPKEIIFVADASRSIPQHKLTATARGLAQALKLLRPEDTFNIVAFRDAPSFFQPRAVPATPERLNEARAFLDSLQARGETDVYSAIAPVIQAPLPASRPGIVVVASDGRPTAGMRDGRAIINSVTAENDLRYSIYAFGGGRTVNRALLDLLAYRNKGETFVSDSITDIDGDLPRFVQRFNDPLLVDLRAGFGRIDEEHVYPKVLPDFYQHRPVAIYGRFDQREVEEFAVRITGKAVNEDKELIFRTSLAEARQGTSEIAQRWAFAKAYDIIGQISEKGESAPLLAQLQQLSDQYSIRTSYDQ